MKKVAVIGASGFAGAEALRLLAAHPAVEVVFASAESQAGRPIAELYPNLAGWAGNREFDAVDPNDLSSVPHVDAAVVCLPHGASMDLAEPLLQRASVVVDLGADFRLSTDDYTRWYGEEHRAPQLVAEAVYSIPELCRHRLGGKRLIANPGCYPTAASLVMAPLVRGGATDGASIIVDAASGVSGAGRPPKPNTTFCAVDEDFTAYGLLNHRHTAEMEVTIGASVLFTPHLAPMNRGILATCYATAAPGLSTAEAMAMLQSAYGREPFVVVSERIPSTKATLGSNAAHLTVRVDHRTGRIVAIAAIDNLGKGAAGQAVQNANLLCGLPETAGLDGVPVWP